MCNPMRLEWDSRFFNQNVFQLTYYKGCDLNLEIKKLYNNEGAEIIYVFSDAELPDFMINDSGGQLVDIKLLFEKKIKPLYEGVDFSGISLYSDNNADSQLLDLAIQSGIESRFKKDIRLPIGCFERMYEIWIDKSVKKEMANAVFIHKIENQTVGLVTVKLMDDFGEVGLFAVDEKYRGQRIGKLLLQRTEKYLIENKRDILLIPTQEANAGAVKFYKSNGYLIKRRTYIYHFIKN
jgi:dTDP-4-amino-4,6-dideoxy-D-galactose acyltransferase